MALFSIATPVVFVLSLFAGQAQASCDVDYAKTPKELFSLEEAAGRGALTKETMACLDASYGAADQLTTKDKISRVMLINAYAYSTRQWAELVDRHLKEVDRSDPAISYLYTFYLSNRSEPDYDAVIKWSEVALERRAFWKGTTYTNRTFQLLKVRTLAATGLWEHYAKEGDNKRSDESRLQAKTYAREWLDFAKSSGWDTSEAALMCTSAASKEACGILE